MNLPDVANDNLSSFEKSLYGFLFRDSRKSFITALILLFIFTGILVGLRLHIGCLPLADAGAIDGVFQLELGHRVASGQRPHVDFISPMGVLQYILMHLGILICGMKGAALTMGYLVFLPVLLVSTWTICARRMAYLPASFITIATVALLLGANALGNPLASSSYETVYNRLGFALVSPLLVAGLLPTCRGGRIADSLCIGVMLACAVFLKINFAIGGIALFLFGLAIRNIKFRELPLIIAGILVVMIIVSVYMRGHLWAYFADTLRLMKSTGSNALSIGISKTWFNIADVRFGLVLLSVFIWTQGYRVETENLQTGLKNSGLAFLIKNVIGVIAAIGIVFFMMLGCMRLDKFMLSYVIIFVVFAWTAAVFKNSFHWRTLTVGLLGFVCAGFFAFDQTQSVVNAWRHVIMINNSVRECHLLDNRELNDFRFILQGIPVSEELNTGTELLRKNNVSKDKVVYSLTMFNCWPLLYGSSYRIGDWAWLHYDLIFDEQHQPTQHELFDSVDVVLIPTKPVYSNFSKQILGKYGKYFNDTYYLKDKNSEWLLYFKK